MLNDGHPSVRLTSGRAGSTSVGRAGGAIRSPGRGSGCARRYSEDGYVIELFRPPASQQPAAG